MISSIMVTSIQNNDLYDIGFGIGYILGKIFPFLIFGAIIFLIIKILKKKSKK